MQKSESIVQLLFQLQKSIHEKVRNSGETLPLTMSEAMTLKFIMHKKNATVSELASCMTVRKASASALIKQMEEKGLIKRKNNEDDARSHYLFATPKAKALIKKVEGFFARHGAPLFEVLTKAEKKQLERLLQKIIYT